jgi:hypothetical protein
LESSPIIFMNLDLEAGAPPWSGKILFIFIHLFTCAYIVWAISPPCPQPSFPLQPPHFQAEPVLPLTLILLKRRHKQ